ncbi:hypothetical protein H6G80_34970 [Nostoc sp. FACHB-87]|uniref:hypothetical protein n=1 Tax=Nostocaceae TaxID=1162 RepID=UPI0016860A85|nr:MULTISPECIES: hypothetical protein [Nostocaceae]MBD2459226.1 hypothetical protein [Nostoc sp. FACHB-87]MBD2479574.1 hypothetical protein [Anabaena sp. FACHB-83]
MNTPPRKRKKSISAQSTDNISSVNSKKDTFDLEHPATATITVTAIEIPELTDDELRDRLHLERKVERAFFEAGKALAELRDRRLYRSTHRTFEEYCKDRFSYTHRHVNYLIAASLVVDNIKMGTNGSQNEEPDEMGTNGSQILPTNERQVRPLITLEPQQQQEVWQTAVKEAGGKVPSGRIVKDVVQRIMERTKVPNTYRVGEVCQILAKDNPDLRGKGGCWCIVTHVGEFSCTLKTWDGELTVGVQHLKSFDYLPDECQQMQEVCDRIMRLRESENLEEAAKAVLKYLGEVKRPYLTDVEKKLLSVIEQEYWVAD